MKKIFILILLMTGINFSQTDTLFYEDFEDGLQGWTAINLADSTQPTLWRVTNSRYVSPGHSAAWNDSSTNTYPHGLYEAIESPPISIPYNARTYLSFKAFIHLTLNGTYFHDYFFIKYTTNNGATWNNFLPYAYSGQQLVWRSFPEDFGPTAYDELTSYAGKTMKFRIITRSDTLDPNGLGVFVDNFFIYSEECGFVDLNEPNNNLTTATQVELGDILQASFCPQNDEDFYKFTIQQGEQLNIATQHSLPYTYLYLLNSNGITLSYAYNELTYNITASGTYYIRVTSSYTYSANYSIYFNNRPEPDIISVTDIPEDQGLKVRVKWQASFYDPQNGTGHIKEYQLWRKITDTLQAAKSSTIKLQKLNSATDVILDELWEYMVTVPALSNRPFLNYSYVAPTLADSLPSTFIIAAVPKNETQPVVWGAEGSGFSVDNLSPGLESFSVSPSANGLKVQWSLNYSSNPDLEKIEIYKGVYELFPPVTENKITELTPSVNSYIDTDLLNGFIYYYIISIKDRSGNITFSPAFTTGSITSVDENDNILPTDITLEQNYPNPFNPSTVIKFSLPAVTNITLRVSDILGRELMVLANGNYTPGTHEIVFNAADLSSGIYFYTLSGSGIKGNFNFTKKLLLLK